MGYLLKPYVNSGMGLPIGDMQLSLFPSFVLFSLYGSGGKLTGDPCPSYQTRNSYVIERR